MKMKLIIAALAFFVTVGSASAQSCPGRSYTESEKTAVSASMYHLSAYIQRMHQLALQSATLKLTNGQRLALEMEFRAYVIDMATFVEQYGQNLSSDSQAFVRFITDPARLGFNDLRLIVPTGQSPVKQGVRVAERLVRTLPSVWGCM